MKPTALTPIGPRVIKQDLVTQLLHAIFSGRFVGGDRLVEKDLAEEFAVSRTPVREALGQLVATGLIEMQPNRGAVVRSFGPDQLRDIYTLRQILESHAARLAHGNLDREAFEQVRDETAALLRQRKRDQAWADGVMSIDEKLHDLIAAASGNERLHEEIDRYRKLVRAIRQAISHQPGYQTQALKEHLVLIDALLTGTADDAADAMSQHIGESSDVAVGVVFATKRRTGNASAPKRTRK
ncbi:MAG: GntR family transcriptional regulator [Phycisphaerales bacterium JB063]